MNKGDIEVIRGELKRIAQVRFADRKAMVAGANIAIDVVCDAKVAEADLMANNISSYSIQGRSITKRNLADIPWDLLMGNLSYYFDPSEIPFPTTGNNAICVDFSGGLE